jgi:hypothetical protein
MFNETNFPAQKKYTVISKCLNMILLDVLTSISMSKLIQFLGGTLVVSGGVSVLIFEWLKNRWKKRNDEQLEALKGEIQRSNSAVGYLSSAYLTNFNKVQDKRIEAAEHLWSAVLKIKDAIPPVVYMAHTILLDEEFIYQKVAGIATIKQETMAIDEMLHVQQLNTIRKEMEFYKPFLMDKADLLFTVYQGLIGRVSFNFIKGFRKGIISSWKKDEPTKNFLKQVLSGKEMNAIYTARVSSFEIAITILQTKILSEIRESLYGKNLTLDTLEHLKFMDTNWQKEN